jgi:hypothetical protein
MDGLYQSIYHTLSVTNSVQKTLFTNFTSLLIFCWFEFGFFIIKKIKKLKLKNIKN